jgi:hypothetical protein
MATATTTVTAPRSLRHDGRGHAACCGRVYSCLISVRDRSVTVPLSAGIRFAIT